MGNRGICGRIRQRTEARRWAPSIRRRYVELGVAVVLVLVTLVRVVDVAGLAVVLVLVTLVRVVIMPVVLVVVALVRVVDVAGSSVVFVLVAFVLAVRHRKPPSKR